MKEALEAGQKAVRRSHDAAQVVEQLSDGVRRARRWWWPRSMEKRPQAWLRSRQSSPQPVARRQGHRAARGALPGSLARGATCDVYGETVQQLLSLKHARQPGDFRGDLSRWIDLIEDVLNADNGVSALAAVVSYILEATPTTHQELEVFFHQIGPSAEQAYMTGAQELIQQGLQQGLEKGRAEGRAELLLRQLQLKFGAVAEETVTQVRAADVAQLDLWAERVLTATTLEQVFAD